jgi:hypothetical protein
MLTSVKPPGSYKLPDGLLVLLPHQIAWVLDV